MRVTAKPGSVTFNGKPIDLDAKLPNDGRAAVVHADGEVEIINLPPVPNIQGGASISHGITPAFLRRRMARAMFNPFGLAALVAKHALSPREIAETPKQVRYVREDTPRDAYRSNRALSLKKRRKELAKRLRAKANAKAARKDLPKLVQIHWHNPEDKNEPTILVAQAAVKDLRGHANVGPWVNTVVERRKSECPDGWRALLITERDSEFKTVGPYETGITVGTAAEFERGPVVDFYDSRVA